MPVHWPHGQGMVVPVAMGVIVLVALVVIGIVIEFRKRFEMPDSANLDDTREIPRIDVHSKFKFPVPTYHHFSQRN